jgi:hypothetical protein
MFMAAVQIYVLGIWFNNKVHGLIKVKDLKGKFSRIILHCKV